MRPRRWTLALAGLAAGFLTSPAGISHAADVRFVAVLKGQGFHQTSADIVSLGDWRTWHDTMEVQNEGEHGVPPHLFEVFAFGQDSDSIVTGSVVVPGGAVQPLAHDFRGDENLEEIGVENGYLKPLELEAERPDGTYTVQLVTKNDGIYSAVLSLTGGNSVPVPHVTNFTHLQSAAASSPVAVLWSAMGGTPQDFVHCKVRQIGGMDDGMILWHSGMPGEPGALDGTSTGVAIPAGVLQAGTDYQAEVMFVKTTDVSTSPVLATAGYYKITGFRIRTAAAPGMPLGARLLASNPKDGWSSVALDAAVAFHFSHPMSPAHISIGWTKDGGPLVTGTFSYHWTRGDTVLLCLFSDDLPPDSEIGWTLNLAGFRDAAGFALVGSPSGSFRTGIDGPESPPDVGFLSVIKTRTFTQSGLTPVAEGRHEAVIELEANAPNRLKSAGVTALANGRGSPLFADPWNGDEYEAPGEYASAEDLERFYPNGDYQFALDGLADGPQAVTLSLGVADQYPDAPEIGNLAALQAVDPAAPVTVTWSTLPDWTNDMMNLGPGDGWVEFEILDSCGREVFWVEGSEMTDGVSCVVPAGTLRPGRIYQASVFFLRITDIDVTSHPGAFAVAAFESQTGFTIQTTGEMGIPVIAMQRVGSDVRIAATGGEPESGYMLEASSDLSRWTPLDAYWNPQGGFIYQYDDTDARYFKARFYRVSGPRCEEPVMRPVSIQGTVWTDGAHHTPVAGAVVGTSLDGRTTVSDAQGRFFLITDKQPPADSYTITVRSGAQTKNFGPMNWGDQPREQNFGMD